MVQNVLTGKKYCPLQPSENGVRKFFFFWGGVRHFFGFPPQGAVPPIRPVLVTPRWTPVFKWGNCPPFGEIWVFENYWNLAFGRTLSSIISKCYRDILDKFVPMDTLLALLQNLKIWLNSDENKPRKVQLNFANLFLDLVGLWIFSGFWGPLQWANDKVTQGQSLNGAR